jgi:hypothetical protein
MTILDASQIFFNFAAGIAALGGLVIYSGKAKRIAYSLKYPASKVDKTFHLVTSPKTGNRIFLIDIKAKTRRWIASSSTFMDLGFEWDKVKEIKTEELESHKLKAPMFTSGIPGR